ncbi:hypothetical protein AB0M43_37975 [Longispora sp. NPDC051575]|uniref:helix-turn-helix domain-containing protein n=1 Tax=Longispora sp. NPDC051575 TaxID=3154943 RepID=UPI0034241860
MNKSERVENTVQVLVLLAVGGVAGAASFTHMHDWTMANAPTGTGNWFGWANAVVSELIPMAAALEIRRRRRNGQPTGYAMAVMIGFALLSLAAQVAQAKASASGWLLAAVPAIGFLALTKMVLSRVPIVASTAANAVMTVAAPVAAQLAAPPVIAPVTVADMPADTPRPPVRSSRRMPAKPDTATAVAKLRAKHPDMSQDEMAARLSVAPRTVRRHLAAQRADIPDTESAALQAA